MYKSCLAVVAMASLVAACSEPGEPPVSPSVSPLQSPVVIAEPKQTLKPDPWQMVEAFEVGREVYVRSLALEPAANSLWVGTSVGVHEVDIENQSLRRTFTRADGLANEYVFAIFNDSHGYKWFGTNGGGTSRYRDDEWQVYFPMHGIGDYWVYSFAEQSNGDVWIGTWDGVTHWDAVTAKFTTYVTELVNEWVYGISVDSQDRVWFATEGGVSMFDGQQWQAWTHNDGLGAENEEHLPISFNTGLGTRSRHDLNVMTEGQRTYNPNYIFSILVDKNDEVWAGTWGAGVAKFDGKNWTNYSVNDGLAGNVVYSIAEAKDGTLWFGTDRGLSRYDGERWFNYGRAQGLLSEHVYAVAVVSENEVWAGTKGGVTRFALSNGLEKNLDAETASILNKKQEQSSETE